MIHKLTRWKIMKYCWMSTCNWNVWNVVGLRSLFVQGELNEPRDFQRYYEIGIQTQILDICGQPWYRLYDEEVLTGNWQLARHRKSTTRHRKLTTGHRTLITIFLNCWDTMGENTTIQNRSNINLFRWNRYIWFIKEINAAN